MVSKPDAVEHGADDDEYGHANYRNCDAEFAGRSCLQFPFLVNEGQNRLWCDMELSKARHLCFRTLEMEPKNVTSIIGEISPWNAC